MAAYVQTQWGTSRIFRLTSSYLSASAFGSDVREHLTDDAYKHTSYQIDQLGEQSYV
jgi:hypothetical protein